MSSKAGQPPDTEQRIRERRQDVGLSQTELAALAGVSTATVGNLECRRPGSANRTRAAIERALAMRQHPNGLHAVLAADLVRGVADAVLPLIHTPQGQRLRFEWDALIAALASDQPSLSGGYGLLLSHLRDQLPPVRAEAFCAAVDTIVSASRNACAHCHGTPPSGFTCNTCGTGTQP